jgi:hypothetical protein
VWNEEDWKILWRIKILERKRKHGGFNRYSGENHLKVYKEHGG